MARMAIEQIRKARAAAFCAAVLLAGVFGTARTEAHPVNIGHRGGTVDRPENTLVNFDFALQNGTDWIETDVWLSSDGIPVLHHDETLDRTTNGTGFVWEKSLAELKQLDAGSWFGPAYTGTRIPTLEEALQLIRGRGKILIEIKRVDYIPAVAQVIDSVAFPHEDVVTWIRLGSNMAEIYKQAVPGSPVILEANQVFGWDERDIWQRAAAGDHGLLATYLSIDQDWVDLAHSYGLATYGAIVVSPFFDQMIGLGLDGLVVSHPRLLAERLPGPMPECQDGLDNDGDGQIDAPNDLGCFGPEDTAELSPCSDGVDNDGDGLTDHPADPGCYSAFYPLENPECDDGVDNLGDGLTDYPAAPGCFARFDQTETTACGDGLDNDADGLVDFPEDPGCISASDSSERGPAFACDNGIDEDGDNLIDFPSDPGCSSATDTNERTSAVGCDNGLDDDGDALVDFPNDPGCFSPTDTNERGVNHKCDNSVDDDQDGYVDFPNDPGCSSVLDSSELKDDAPCDNGLDDDGDGFIDHPDDPTCVSPSSAAERGSLFVCDNGLDDDGDGLTDYPDDDSCLHPSTRAEAPEPGGSILLASGLLTLHFLGRRRIQLKQAGPMRR